MTRTERLCRLGCCVVARWRVSPEFRDNVVLAVSVALIVLVLGGCADPEPRPLQALVCTADGQETFRSKPTEGWYVGSGGDWVSQGWRNRYRQSMRESCHTEDVQ